MTTDRNSSYEPTHLDLFSGIGGFALAAQWAGFRTIGFCEIEKYCQKVLAKHFVAQIMADSFVQRVQDDGCAETSGAQGKVQTNGSKWEWVWANARQCGYTYGDIRNLNGRDFTGVTLITGGFPCQPFSVAGKRRGAADDRALWPEMLRVIEEARPAWVLGENVTGIITMELDTVLSDLEALGYSTRTFVIPACGVDARHRRNRVWIVAHSGGIGNDGGSGECRGQEGSESCHQSIRPSEHAVDLADAISSRVEGSTQAGDLGSCRSQRDQFVERCSGACTWPEESQWFLESGMGRVAHGVSHRVDRLKGLGNAIVPQVAYQILKEIRKLC